MFPKKVRECLREYSDVEYTILPRNSVLYKILKNKEMSDKKVAMVDFENDILLSKAEEKVVEKLDIGKTITPEDIEPIRLLYKYYTLSQSNIYREMAMSLRKDIQGLVKTHMTSPTKILTKNKAVIEAAKNIEKLENMAKGSDDKKIDIHSLTDHELLQKMNNG